MPLAIISLEKSLFAYKSKPQIYFRKKSSLFAQEHLTSKRNHIKVEWLINFVVVGYVETNDDLQKEHIESVRYLLCRHKSLERKEIRQKSCLTFKSTTNEKLKWDLKWAITAASLGVLFVKECSTSRRFFVLFVCRFLLYITSKWWHKNSHVRRRSLSKCYWTLMRGMFGTNDEDNSKLSEWWWWKISECFKRKWSKFRHFKYA